MSKDVKKGVENPWKGAETRRADTADVAEEFQSSYDFNVKLLINSTKDLPVRVGVAVLTTLLNLSEPRNSHSSHLQKENKTVENDVKYYSQSTADWYR